MDTEEAKLRNLKIILASSSPRRRELLSQIGLTYEVRTKEVDEHIPSVSPSDLVSHLSLLKASAVVPAPEEGEACVIGADTVVALDGKVLGEGQGTSKQNAQQAAARDALRRMGNQG